ncbi:MAG: cell envelope integrity protein CreD [Thiobacillus sp.]|nr:cell envelope integrity protein CreD [Thiobacillus sp.]
MGKLLNTKLIALAVLALVLIFAVEKVAWKVQERQATRNEAVRSIADQYAHDQQLVGPLIWLKCSEPVSVSETDKDGSVRRRNVVSDCSRLVRPSQITGQGSLDVTERYRGIYKARVYLAGLKLDARLPAYRARPGQTIQEAHLVFGVSDPRGLKRIHLVAADGRPMQARPGVPGGTFGHGFHVPLDPARLDQGLSLAAELEIAGSGRLDFVPVAENNDFSLRSAWPHPGFAGRFLPETRAIGPDGFTARWRVNDFATGGDRVLAEREDGGRYATRLGVSLVDPVDAYSQTDRAVRYGFLFVLLTLGGFFLFELLKGRPVHPLQYLLIGFAVVLFFLLLLALSEHIAFALAYLIAASACVLLISAYGRTLIGQWRGAAALGSGYGLLYLGLYQLLASEDYALLMGAWLIFGLLALTMYLTRRLDWGRAGQATGK